MRALVADADPVARTLTTSLLSKWGWTVMEATSGAQAQECLNGTDAPRVALLANSLDQPTNRELCEQVCEAHPERALYTILLETVDRPCESMSPPCDAADDCITGPVDAGELFARLTLAKQIIELQDALTEAQLALRARSGRF